MAAAAAALNQREFTSSKLKESVRQLRRYLEGGGKSKRIIENKCKNIESEKADLFEFHYCYAEKSKISLADPDMVTFITENVDVAEDVLNEALCFLEDLDNTDEIKEKKSELLASIKEMALLEDVVMHMVSDAKKFVAVENPSSSEVLQVQFYVNDLPLKERALFDHYAKVRNSVEENKQDDYYKREIDLRVSLNDIYTKMRVFIKKNSVVDSEVVDSEKVSSENKGGSKASVRLEKLKPPSFSGNIRHFARFKDDFESIIRPAYDGDSVYITYVLKKCLLGEAHELVRNLADEEEIWRRLEDKYGDTIEVVDSVINDLQNVKINRGAQDSGVIELVNILEAGVRDLTAIGKLSEIANSYTVKIIEQKLPRRVMMKWLEEMDSLDGVDRFEALFQFLKAERKRIERLVQISNPKIQDGVVNEKNSNVAAKKNVFNAEYRKKTESGGRSNKCLMHPNSTNHLTRKCKQFLDKSVAEREKIVKDAKGCKFCLSTAHESGPCPWAEKWKPCDVNNCGQFHSRLLHPTPNPLASPFAGAGNHVNCKASGDGDGHASLLLIQDVYTFSNDPIILFWDSGSNISLVRKEYAVKHGLDGVNVSYELLTLGNSSIQNTVLYDVPIYDRSGKKHVIKAYAIDTICESGVEFSQDICKLFKDELVLKDIKRDFSTVDVLIGMNYANLHPEPLEKVGSLVLFQSKFGSGRILGGQHKVVSVMNQVNHAAKIVSAAKGIKIELLKASTGVDFFSAEDLGIKAPVKCKKCKGCKDCVEMNDMSRCEQYELEVIRNNLKFDEEKKRWVTTYPYKKLPVEIRDNKEQALKFLHRTERRLEKNPVVSQQYCQQFDDLCNRGAFKEIPDDELMSYKGPTFYITHHEVFKEESSSTPVRIVSNSSLKNQDGVSLNSLLMKGPNMLNNIFGVQLRFRTYPVALVGDVAKMYNSIDTTVKERHLRRLLWRNMNSSEEPKVYGVEVVMFGDTPAAAIADEAVCRSADKGKEIDEVAAEKIKKDRFVDDLATGDKDRESCMKLKESISKILGGCGFKMKGFVMSGDNSEESLSLLGTGEIGRILGIGWKPLEDMFTVKVRINTSKKYKGTRMKPDINEAQIKSLADEKLTRRMLLSVTNSCYDPLGVMCPVTIQLKIELRKLYSKELSLSWDDDIPHEMKKEWVKLIQRLKSIDGIQFPRCIYDPESVGDPELIVFCDGSTLAMCTAAYVRWRLKTGGFCSYLFAAKARVTPLERSTIPRIEMQSAVLGVRLAETIINHSGLKFKEVYYISDSTCTIATLKKDSVALKEYMGNRVAEINASTNINQWYHVRSEENIADLGTRMTATDVDVVADSIWQRGPAWLREEVSSWPVSQSIISADVPEESDDELTKKGTCYYGSNKEDFLSIKKYTSYSFLMNLTARLMLICELKTFGVRDLTTCSIEKAEKYWVLRSMELTKIDLQKGKLRSLRPIVSEDGIISVGSRALEGMKLHYNAESFPILTYKDPLAELWMREMHNEDHSGITRTMAKSRRKFWIIKARRLSQKVKYGCYRCRLLDHKMEVQLMSPLPMFRQTIAPVFNVTSIDLFGPIQIKDMVKKRTKMKVWGLICTCAAVRAVYVDVVEAYSADAAIQTLRKFTALRGCPSKFICDPGSQLKAISQTDILNWTKVKNWATSNKITWEIVPADSQHKNGLSESLIKSVKRSIAHVIGENVLSFSELQLMFYEIANIINTRPIGLTHGEDPEATHLTPNDLILGRSSNEAPQGPFEANTSLTRRFKFVQTLIDNWWKHWYVTVLPSLVPSYKWHHKRRNVQIGDICLISYKGTIRSTYRLGRIVGVSSGVDGRVRTVKLEYRNPDEKVFRTVERSVHGIAVIIPVDEQVVDDNQS